jgi:hypothetical protein
MTAEKNLVPAHSAQPQASISPSRSLPPLLSASTPTSPEEVGARKEAREQKDALVRGVTSVHAMREAIRRVARTIPAISAVPRLHLQGTAAFRTRAAQGLPFLVTGLVNRWPLSSLTPQALRDSYGDLPVRARVGDYVNTAFAPDRAMQDMTMRDYLDLVFTGLQSPPPDFSSNLPPNLPPGLPPYLGNLELRQLNSLCHWPAYLGKMGPPRFWLGPAGTVTPLHCDYDDNIFAQIWGSKRIFLAPPHHDQFLYPSEANAILFGSPFNPEAPDFEQFPLARQALMIECIVHPGELLYVPAGWYHQVRSLTFSLSANRWARAMPFALNGDPSLLRPAE